MNSIFTFLLLYTGACHCYENKCQGQYLGRIMNKCVLAHGGDFNHLSDLLENRLSRDENGKCFRACVMLHCGYYNYDGMISYEVPRQLANILHGGDFSHVEIIEEAATKCVDMQIYDNSLCNMSEEFIRCLITYSPIKLKLFGVYD